MAMSRISQADSMHTTAGNAAPLLYHGQPAPMHRRPARENIQPRIHGRDGRATTGRTFADIRKRCWRPLQWTLSLPLNALYRLAQHVKP